MNIHLQASAWAEVWDRLRDHAKPVVPRDVDELAAVREFTPPSKAHVKRLKRSHAGGAKDKPKAYVADGGARLRFNEAYNLGLKVKALQFPPCKEPVEEAVNRSRENWRIEREVRAANRGKM